MLLTAIAFRDFAFIANVKKIRIPNLMRYIPSLIFCASAAWLIP